MLPLASIAAWCAGDDPSAAGRRRRRSSGGERSRRRATASCPSGSSARSSRRPTAPAGSSAAMTSTSWLTEAATCAAPDLEAEAAPWLEQVHAEAALAQRALTLAPARLGRGSSDQWTAGSRALVPDAARVLRHAFGVASEWPVVRRAVASRVRPAVRRATRAAAAPRAALALARRRDRGGRERDRRPRAPRARRGCVARRRRDRSSRSSTAWRWRAARTVTFPVRAGLRRARAMWRRGQRACGCPEPRQSPGPRLERSAEEPAHVQRRALRGPRDRADRDR